MPLGGFRLNSLAVYQAPSGPDYTVPTAAFTSDANTRTLLKFENNVTDTSGNYSYTNNNGTYNTTTKQFGSYSWFSASSASVVRYVNSTANVTSPTAWNNTIEGWIYPTSYTDQEYAYGSGVPKGIGWTAGSDWGLSVGVTNSGFLRVFWYQGGYQAITSTATVPLNQWSHIVFQFDKNTNAVKLGLNGYWVATGSITGSVGDNRFTVGTVRLNSPNNYWDEVRYSNALRYTSRTAKTITVAGNAQIDTAQSKFGGASALFDGTGDYLTISPYSDIAPGTNDFCFEGWFRIPNNNVDYALFGCSGTNGDMVIRRVNDGTIRLGRDDVAWDLTSSVVSIANTWAHIAVCRSGSTAKIFLNGSQVATGTNTQNYVLNDFRLGDESGFQYNGHMDEIRVSNIARYTANFTAPTEPFVNDANTLLLLHCNGTDASTIFQDDNA